MKKLKTFLICLFAYFVCEAQYPITTNIGGPTTLVKTPNYGGVQSGIIPYTFTDTSNCNSLAPYLKQYNGSLIWTTTPPAIWYRASTLNKWVQLIPGADTSSVAAWSTRLNTNIPTDASLNGFFGTTAGNGIGFWTSGVQRFILPASGLSLNSSISDTTLNKVLTYNTSTKNLGYSYWYGSGGSGISTASNGLTASGGNVKLGGNLVQNTSVSGDNGTYGIDIEQMSFIALEALQPSTSNISALGIFTDSLNFQPYNGRINIDTLNNETFQNTIMGWTSTSGTNRGRVGYITIGTGLSLSSGVLSNTVTAGANTALSNLASVAINTSLLPGTDNSIDLGSTTKTWRNEYVSGAIAIGSTSTTFDVDVRKTTNGSIGFGVQNASSGTSAAAVFQLGRSYGADFYVSHYYAGDGNTVYTPLSYNIINAVGSTGGMFFNNIASATMGFLTANTTRMTILGGGNIGIGDATPASLFTVGSGDLFQVNSSGDVVKLKNVTYSWPSSNSSGVLLNNGSGTLSWTATSSLSGLPYVALTGTSTATGDITLDINGNNLYLTNTSGSGEFLFYDPGVNEGVTLGFSGNVFFKAERSTNKAYIYSNAISGASTGDAVTIANPSTGELTVAPNLAFMLRKDSTDMYTSNGRIFVKDAAGNRTQISPHNDKGEWIYKSTDNSGITTEINMIHLAELLEKVTGEKLIYRTKN